MMVAASRSALPHALLAAGRAAAADAAALAGVVWLPDLSKATEVALDVARLNGYDNADPEVTVTVSQVSASHLRV